jgi:hypothetical protein
MTVHCEISKSTTDVICLKNKPNTKTTGIKLQQKKFREFFQPLQVTSKKRESKKYATPLNTIRKSGEET